MKMRNSSWTGMLLLILVFFLWNVPFLTRRIYVDPPVFPEMIATDLLLLASLFFSLYRGGHSFTFALMLWVSVVASFLLGLSGQLGLSSIFMLAAVISVLPILLNFSRKEFESATFTFAFFVLLALLSTSLRFFVPSTSIGYYSGYVFSIYDNASPAGIPFTYYYGMVIGLRNASITFSPVILLTFPLVSFFAVKNTYLILERIGRLNTTGSVNVFVTSLACQCENTIGLISGTASSFAISILPSLLFISLFFLILTNVYLRARKLPMLRIERRLFFPLSFAGLVAFQTYLNLSGLLTELVFFGLLSFTSVILGIFIGLYLPFTGKAPRYLLLVAVLLQAASLIPFFIQKALDQTLYFEVYEIAGILSGFLFGYIIKNSVSFFRAGVIELVFSMEVMMTVFVLYLSIFHIGPFNFVPLNQIVEFAVAILLISLPMMWASNIYLLSMDRKPIIKRFQIT